MAFVYYLMLLTDGDWNLFGTELCALLFNDMLGHLFHGDVTIQPAIIGGEAFISHGRTVTYWGIFPALLRLPLVPFGVLYELQISRLSCWIAICGLAGFLVATFVHVHRRAAPSAGRSFLFHVIVVSVLFAGTVPTSLASAYIYNETTFWAVALAAAFNYVVLRRLLDGRSLRSGDLIVLACIAGLALNCRVLEGVALCLAFTWIATLTVFGGERNLRPVILPSAILALFGALSGAVNYLRWGSPLTFIDLSRHTQFIADPDRMAALHAFGSLNLLRLPFALSYYLLGRSAIADAQALSGNFGQLYDKMEGPLSALVLTDTIPLILAVVGMVHILRNATRSHSHAILAGVLIAELVGIVILLSANYLAMRYRMDFLPAMFLAAATGYSVFFDKGAVPRSVPVAALALLIVSAIASHDALARYKEDVRPYREQAKAFWDSYQCAQQLKECPR